MTDKDKVLKVYGGNADVTGPNPDGTYVIATHIGDGVHHIIGKGIGVEAAWHNAAESFPAECEIVLEDDAEFFHEPDCPCYSEQHSRDCKNCECQCQRPPEGWRCTRGYGHTGPCAATPLPPASTNSPAIPAKEVVYDAWGKAGRLVDKNPVVDKPTKEREQEGHRNVHECLQNALGAYQVTHCHAYIKEALKEMEKPESDRPHPSDQPTQKEAQGFEEWWDTEPIDGFWKTNEQAKKVAHAAWYAALSHKEKL